MRLLRSFAILTLCSAIAAGCNGCKKEPQMWLTYGVDVEHAYDGRSNDAATMELSRSTLLRRLEPIFGVRAVTVTARGHELVIGLPRMDEAQLREVEAIVQDTGRVEIQGVDEQAPVFAHLAEADVPKDEGISLSTESAPDGGSHDLRARLPGLANAHVGSSACTHQ
jgi:hypothetical protein